MPVHLATCTAVLLLGAVACGGSVSGNGSRDAGSEANVPCSAFDDHAGQSVTVKIVNATNAPIYVGGAQDCEQLPFFTLSDANGAPQPLVPDNCGTYSCKDLQSEGPGCVMLCATALPTARIDPGGSYATSWDGGVYRSVAMPARCYINPDMASATCDQEFPAATGGYVVHVKAGTSVTCDSPPTCGCQPNASGACEIQAGAEAQTLSGQASFEYPSDRTVTVRVQ